MTLNVGRVMAVTPAGLQLAEPLLAGAPTEGMQAQSIVALQDREGGTFFQEWSGLFACRASRAMRCSSTTRACRRWAALRKVPSDWWRRFHSFCSMGTLSRFPWSIGG